MTSKIRPRLCLAPSNIGAVNPNMPLSATADRLIAALKLEPLPGEGGYFRQTWRGETSSAIFFLMTKTDFSALHRIAQDELWHFYGGDSVEHIQLDRRNGAAAARVVRLGPGVLAGETPQLVVPAGVWQGARLAPGSIENGFALLGCTVSPPWDDRGFTLGKRAELTAAFPLEAEWIRSLTR
jgi:uncharacterized protein